MKHKETGKDFECSDDENADDGSEVVASSDGELDPNEYKQDGSNQQNTHNQRYRQKKCSRN